MTRTTWLTYRGEVRNVLNQIFNRFVLLRGLPEHKCSIGKARYPAERMTVLHADKVRSELEPLELRCLLSTSLSIVATLTDAAPLAAGDLVIDSAGSLYGISVGGSVTGNGSVFRIASGSHEAGTLVAFDGGGSAPNGLVIDANGNLSGTTAAGGDLNLPGGVGGGTIFNIAAGGGPLRTLAEFEVSNGYGPTGGLISDASGNLYGTTSAGGAYGAGAVFMLPANSQAIKLVASFPLVDSNFALPTSDLVIDRAGNLYGVTERRPSTLFEIRAGSHSPQTIATFPSDAAYQVSSLTIDANGDLYGIAGNRIVELAAGSRQLVTIAKLSGRGGAGPGLLIDSRGTLFGTSLTGGAHGLGSVFKIAAGSHIVTTIATFDGLIGSYPFSRLIADRFGNFFGESLNRRPGSEDDVPNPMIKNGSVFEVVGAGFELNPNAPVVFTQPADATVVEGEVAAISVVIGSSPASTIRWQLSHNSGHTFNDIAENSSAGSPTLHIAVGTLSQEDARYRAIVSNALGTTTTRSVRVTTLPRLVLAVPAHTDAMIINGHRTTLKVLAADPSGTQRLRYRWSVLHGPSGAKPVAFSNSGKFAAKKSVATFYKSGGYTLRCTISDRLGRSLFSDVFVNVLLPSSG